MNLDQTKNEELYVFNSTEPKKTNNNWHLFSRTIKMLVDIEKTQVGIQRTIQTIKQSIKDLKMLFYTLKLIQALTMEVTTSQS